MLKNRIFSPPDRVLIFITRQQIYPHSIPPTMNLHIKQKEVSEEKTKDAEMTNLHHGHYLISLPILSIYPISFSFYIPFILRNGYDV